MIVAITHAAWSPGRPESLARLLAQLGQGAETYVLTSTRREPVVVWARRLWDFVSAQKEPVICIQDDVLLHPHFLQACEVILNVVPDEIVSLHTQAPEAKAIAEKGSHWGRAYWLSAPCYILPPKIATDLLDFWSRNYVHTHNEDNIVVHWAWQKQKPFLATLPALACHDSSLPSTLGYDNHPHRTPSVPWGPLDDVTSRAFWTLPQSIPYIPSGPPEFLERVRIALRGSAGLCTCCTAHEAVMSFPLGIKICQVCAKQVTLASLGRIL